MGIEIGGGEIGGEGEIRSWTICLSSRMLD
jgi:hypothetical protein